MLETQYVFKVCDQLGLAAVLQEKYTIHHQNIVTSVPEEAIVLKNAGTTEEVLQGLTPV